MRENEIKNMMREEYKRSMHSHTCTCMNQWHMGISHEEMGETIGRGRDSLHSHSSNISLIDLLPTVQTLMSPTMFGCRSNCDRCSISVTSADT